MTQPKAYKAHQFNQEDGTMTNETGVVLHKYNEEGNPKILDPETINLPETPRNVVSHSAEMKIRDSDTEPWLPVELIFMADGNVRWGRITEDDEA